MEGTLGFGSIYVSICFLDVMDKSYSIGAQIKRLALLSLREANYRFYGQILLVRCYVGTAVRKRGYLFFFRHKLDFIRTKVDWHEVEAKSTQEFGMEILPSPSSGHSGSVMLVKVAHVHQSSSKSIFHHVYGKVSQETQNLQNRARQKIELVVVGSRVHKNTVCGGLLARNRPGGL